MADDTANITHGPRPDALALDANGDTPVTVDAAGTSAEQPAPAGFADAQAIRADVDLIGASSSPVATVGEREPVPVLMGAAAMAGVDESSSSTASPAIADAPPRVGSGFGGGDDVPRWSFGDPAAPPSATPTKPVDRNQGELSFRPAEEAAVFGRRPQAMFGPVGRPRSAVLVPLLAAVSLGVYALVWHQRINRELEEFDPKLQVRPVRSTLAATVPWLVGLLITLAGAALVVTARLSIHLPFDTHVTSAQAYYLLAGLAAVPYLTLILPFSLVAVVMTIERLRCVEEHVGITTDRQVRPVSTALLLAIPVIGGLVLLGVEQERINAIWSAVAPTERLSS